MPLKIIVDSREKKDFFTFNSYKDVEVVNTKLDTGDYSLLGFENRITIDRKRNTNELQMCFGQSWKRFQRELERMTKFEEAYILCTFPRENLYIFPEKSGIPFSRWKKIRTCAKFLVKRYRGIEDVYRVKFIFCDSNYEAEQRTYEILRDFYDKQS